MENLLLPEYLSKPSAVKAALAYLDRNRNHDKFEELFRGFVAELGIQAGDSLPVTTVVATGEICRARVNDENFPISAVNKISEIGMNPNRSAQGRANALNYAIFYGANCKQTAAYEVLQKREPGQYIVTIGCWKDDDETRIINLVDDDDTDFKDVPFMHSHPKRYLDDWPPIPKTSALMIFEFFKDRFKSRHYRGLYNITNVIAAMFFSLQDIDGIAYGAVSHRFKGINFALKNPTKLKCVTAERWLVTKTDFDVLDHVKLQIAAIRDDGMIYW